MQINYQKYMFDLSKQTNVLTQKGGDMSPQSPPGYGPDVINVKCYSFILP